MAQHNDIRFRHMKATYGSLPWGQYMPEIISTPAKQGNSKPNNYAMVMEKINKFCVSKGLKDKFSSSTIEQFVTDLSQQHKLSHSTIQANLSAIRHYCNSNNIGITFDTPRLKLLLRGVRKVDVGEKQPQQTKFQKTI